MFELFKFPFFTKPQSIQKVQSLSPQSSTYSLTLRGGLNRKLTIEEMDNNFLYVLENASGGGGSVTGTPSQIAYFDNSGNLTGDDNFYRDPETKQSFNAVEVWLMNLPVFSGTGLNDLNAGTDGYYTGLTSSVYTITITTGLSPMMVNPMGASPNQFEWTSTGGASGSGTCSSSFQLLDENVGISFGNISGHTIGDQWTLSFTPFTFAQFVGNLSNNFGIGNVVIDQTNNIGVLNGVVGDTYPKPNIGIYALGTPETNQAALQYDVIDNTSFKVTLISQVDGTFSNLEVESTGVTVKTNLGEYTLPTNTDQGFMYQENGVSNWTNGVSGTYSTDGKLVTVTNGLITKISLI